SLLGLFVTPVLVRLAPGWQAGIIPSFIEETWQVRPNASVASDSFQVNIDPRQVLLGHKGIIGSQSEKPASTSEYASYAASIWFWISMAWASGAIIVFCRLGASAFASRMRTHNGKVLGQSKVVALANRLALQYGIHRRPTLLLAARATIPATWGITS